MVCGVFFNTEENNKLLAALAEIRGYPTRLSTRLIICLIVVLNVDTSILQIKPQFSAEFLAEKLSFFSLTIKTTKS